MYLGNAYRYRFRTYAIRIFNLRLTSCGACRIVILTHFLLWPLQHFPFFLPLLWQPCYSVDAVHPLVYPFGSSFYSVVLFSFYFRYICSTDNLIFWSLKLYNFLLWQHWQTQFRFLAFTFCTDSCDVIKSYMFHLKILLCRQHCFHVYWWFRCIYTQTIALHVVAWLLPG